MGVGCAVIVVVVGVPLGCTVIAGLGLGTAAHQAAKHAAEQQKREQLARLTNPEPKSDQPGEEDSPPADGAVKQQESPSPPAAATAAPPAKAVPKDSHPTDLGVADAAAVFAAYEANEVKADSGMKNRLFAVKGKVTKIGKDILNTPYVALSAEKQFSIFSVQCFFTKADEAALANLQQGQTVVIAGKCGGKMGNVLMQDCWFYDENAAEREKERQQAVVQRMLDDEQRKQNEERRKRNEERKEEEAKRAAKLEEAKWRTWTSADGTRHIEGKFLKAIEGTVHLEKRDGTIVKLQREKLSDDDWKWVKNKGWNTPAE